MYDTLNKHRSSVQRLTNIGLTRKKMLRATAIETLECRRLLSVVLQADFSSAGNLVNLGGTGALISAAGSNMTASQSASSPFVNPDSGGYLTMGA